MSRMTMEEFDALTRLDLQVFTERVFAELNPGATYLDNFHIGVLAAKLDAVRRGECKRLIINVPPRSLKSIIASVAFPAFVLGHDPTKKIIAASYGQELADGLARDCRQVMQQPWYRQLFPGTCLSPTRQAVHAFETTQGGVRIATSVGGVLTGFGADIIIVDDPTKPEDALSEVERNKANQWYSSTLVSRLNNKATGAIIIVMQRLHEEDLVGHVQGLGDWEVVSFSAIAQEDERHAVVTPHGSYVHHRAEGEALHPAFEPLESLSATCRIMGSAFFSAQYLQSPTAPGGNMVKEAWFVPFDPDNPPSFDRIVNAWDTSNKVGELNDYSVCTTWGVKGKKFYLLDVLRQKLEFPDLKRAVRDQANKHRATVTLIEDRASGVQLIQALKSEGMRGVTAYDPKGDKIMRLHAVTAVIEDGRVHLPTNAPRWRGDYLKEVLAFPKAKYDDQVDSTSMALDWLAKPSSFDVWMEVIDRQNNPHKYVKEPHIRVRNVNRALRLGTITGRQLSPDPNEGWFILTEEEWAPISGLPGWTRDG